MTTDSSKYLACVIESHKIRKKQALLDKHLAKRDELINALFEHFGKILYAPFNSGSYAKNTAVNIKFDFDLMTPFKRDAFDTLEQMFTAVYTFLQQQYSTAANIRKQKVSIGLEFFRDTEGDVINIDVVPGRELNQDQYPDDQKLNLYVYDQFGKIAAGSNRLQSRVKAQIENIREHADKQAVREVIRLLKIWRIQGGKPYKSFFLELVTIKAFNNKTIGGDLWQRLKAVLEFIRDNATTLSLPDPGNSNNDIADSLTDVQKAALQDDMRCMLEAIESNSDLIQYYFPVNHEFPCKDDKPSRQGYTVKGEGLTVPPPQRFG